VDLKASQILLLLDTPFRANSLRQAPSSIGVAVASSVLYTSTTLNKRFMKLWISGYIIMLALIG